MRTFFGKEKHMRDILMNCEIGGPQKLGLVRGYRLMFLGYGMELKMRNILVQNGFVKVMD